MHASSPAPCARRESNYSPRAPKWPHFFFQPSAPALALRYLDQSARFLRGAILIAKPLLKFNAAALDAIDNANEARAYARRYCLQFY